MGRQDEKRQCDEVKNTSCDDVVWSCLRVIFPQVGALSALLYYQSKTIREPKYYKRVHFALCHRPWYIGGKISRWILRFAKIALRWCKRWQTVTRIFCHIITDDDRRQILYVVRCTTYYTAFPRGIATSSYPKRYKDIILGICVIILDHTVGIWKILPLGLSPRT